ncbi:hypothetical protein ABH935_006450 [Catenulispora sp. GAS73]|uniref:anti-sigma factor n=1 Tax=Catenulispora sp. GAS73 TaxID=3156269 RepID=UPI003512CA41
MAAFDAVLPSRIGGEFQISSDITAKVLRTAADGSPAALEVVFAAGAKWPGEDAHTDSDELVVVKSGVLHTGVAGAGIDGTDACPADAVVCAEQGTAHVPYSPTGCTLLLFYPSKWAGSQPVAE